VSLPALSLGAVVCELRASRRDLIAALSEAHAAARAKDEFLAVLSHELRTPLQAILGWTRLLGPRLHDAHLVGRGLATIERSAAAQAILIEDLLDVSRIVAGKLRIDRKPVDVAGVITTAVEATRSAAEARSLAVDVRLGPLDGVVVGDAARLQQIVTNLLTNAVKFTPSGGRIVVRLERAGAAARIVVADTGCGISGDLLPHVFDRFRQGDSGATRTQGGLGLGLAIVRHLVELHGGTVTAESGGEAQGATFTVILPVSRAAHAAPHAAREEAAPAVPPGVLDGVRVLVVDDDPDARELLDIALHEAGAEVHVVDSTRAAVGELASFRPDLLLSDIGMPGEDGYALIHEVRSQESGARGHLPAIALTAFASNADRERALACGFDVHVAKPIDAGDLAALAATLLRRAQES
jgi:CheY-like chemotaxis protein/nitrogen-specific signal transduction histidine kinase